jgi:hypothetical protein
MIGDPSKHLQDYVSASQKQGAVLSSAAREFPRTAEGVAQRVAAIRAEVEKRGNSN